MKKILIILIVFSILFLVGCSDKPVPDPIIIDEVAELEEGDVWKIEIEPGNSTVVRGGFLLLTVRAYNYPDMEEVFLDGETIAWKDNCNDPVLDSFSGLNVLYTADTKKDVSQISACYKYPPKEGCPPNKDLCVGITIDIIDLPE